MYKLSCVLHGHAQDVRALAVLPDNSLISGSRDTTVKVWQYSGGRYDLVETLLGHSNYVASVCYLPKSDAHPNGLIITGSNDRAIRGFVPHEKLPVFTLEGHSAVVCCVAPAISTGVLSASWDYSARMWNTVSQENIAVYLGHKAAVWTVLQIPLGLVMTGSADKTVRVYKPDGSYMRSLLGHHDCVRALSYVFQDIILSCSNDGTIRRWNAMYGTCLEVIYGHPNYIYSISLSPDGRIIAAGGEDRCLRVIPTRGTSQYIFIPSQSVWSVVFMPNFDIAVGSSDGTIRIFSKDPDRYADEVTLSLYKDEVNAVNSNTQKAVGGLLVSELPGTSALLEPGHNNGDVKMIRQADGVKCYSWSESKRTWDLIGDVMGPDECGDHSRKIKYLGKDYDFLFTISLAENSPVLNLPYNLVEDPWKVTKNFARRHKVPLFCLRQIADFIITSSHEKTGGKLHLENVVAKSSYLTAESLHASAEKVPIIPHITYVTFENANLLVIRGKLLEFQKKIDDECDKNFVIIKRILAIATSLNPKYNEAVITSLWELFQWPCEYLFPVLDITRMLVLNFDVNNSLCTKGSAFMAVLKACLTAIGPCTNKVMTLRIMANLFVHPPGEELMLENKKYLLSKITQLDEMDTKLEVARTTLLLNLCVASLKSDDVDFHTDCFKAVNMLLPRITDLEALYRGLVALGSILMTSQAHCVSPNVLKLMKSALASKQSPKVFHCCEEIMDIIGGDQE